MGNSLEHRSTEETPMVKTNPSSLGISDHGCYPLVAGLLKRHSDREDLHIIFSKYGKSLLKCTKKFLGAVDGL